MCVIPKAGRRQLLGALGTLAGGDSFLADDLGERITKSRNILCRGLPENGNINGIIPMNEAITHSCH